jgi:hypothetical protein
LESLNGRTALRFYDQNKLPALEVGVDTSSGTRFIRMLGRDGRLLAALNSLPPNGETTLYLGDERWGARIILGAIPSDDQAFTAGVNDWGLQCRKPGSPNPVFNLLLRSVGDTLRTSATIRLVRSDGSVWSR